MLTSSKPANTTPIAASNSLVSKKNLPVDDGSKSLCSFLQPKLTIGAPDDIYEKEADNMAEKVMQMSAPEAISFSSAKIVNRKCAECEEEEKLLRKESTNESISVAPPIVHDVLNSSAGKSLDTDTRAFMEPRFNYNFSNVKVHDNDIAAKSAASINALAYTSGNKVVFNSGQYTTNSDAGKRLLAHELTHVVQQNKECKQIQPLIQRKDDDETEQPMTRSEEKSLSRTSPGLIAGSVSPLSISVFNYTIDEEDLKPEHIALLNELSLFLVKKVKAPVSARLIGHTDSTGGSFHNDRLSRKRALQVKSRLEAGAGQFVRAFWAGEAMPVESNDTVEGRTRNRRVDIYLAPQGMAQDTPAPVPVPAPAPVPAPPSTPIPVPKSGDDEQPGGDGGEKKKKDDDNKYGCDEYPILCGIGVGVGVGIGIGIGVEIGLPLLLCLLNPPACLPIPTLPPGQPPGQPPENPPKTDSNFPFVVFQNVRASNTPAGMNDRISDKNPVTVFATVANQPDPALPISITVINTNSKNGNAKVSSPSPTVIYNSALLQVQGISMTGSVEQPPALQLQATVNGSQRVGLSNAFAVTAIMQGMSQSLVEKYCGENGMGGLGASVDMDSDGANGISSLSEVLWLEALRIIKPETGCFTGAGLGDTFTIPGEEDRLGNVPNVDRHATPWSTLLTCKAEINNRQVIEQFYRMRDLRSNSAYVTIPNSGYRITRSVIEDPHRPGCPLYIIKKEGTPATIQGSSSAAGGTSGVLENRCKLPCPPVPTPEPTPEPTPQSDPQPVPQPDQSSEPCNQQELERRVNQCVDQARQESIDCTLSLLPFSGSWAGVFSSIEFLACLDHVRKELLACDKKAKKDTHCEDQVDEPIKVPERTNDAGKCPSCHDLLEESERLRSERERNELARALDNRFPSPALTDRTVIAQFLYEEQSTR